MKASNLVGSYGWLLALLAILLGAGAVAGGVSTHHRAKPPPVAASPSPLAVTPAPSPVSAAADCIQPSDASSHVYHPDRLKVLKPCVTVTGVIESMTAEADGDVHVRIKVDAGFGWTLNQANMTYQHGYLVVEPVCEKPPTQTDAIPACSGYSNPLQLPPVGTHVSVEGAFVLDSDHGWQEIHPLTALEVLP